MGWFRRKLDTLGGAVCAAIAGAAASQLDAFVQQYLQRLGGHLDEARRHYESVLAPDRYRGMDPAARHLLIDDAQARFEQIRNAFRSLAEAGMLSRPVVFLADLDMEIAARTLEQFRPALPADLTGLVYAGAGLILGLIVYELIKWPFAIFKRERAGRRSLGGP